MKLARYAFLIFAPTLLSCGQNPLELGSLDGADAGDDRKQAKVETPASLCDPTEIIVFDCEVDNTRITICGMNRANGVKPSVTYREAGPDTRTIQIPAVSNPQPRMPTIARTEYSGGGEVQFSFFTDTAEYIAYSRVVKIGRDELRRAIHEAQDGVGQYVDGEFKGIRHCSAGGGLQVTNDASLDTYFEPGEFVNFQIEELPD